MASVNNNIKEGINMFFIYQLKKEARDLLFLSMKQLEKTGTGFSIKNYEMVHAEEYGGETLEEIFVRFNTAVPEGFKGHSLSVSDVVIIRLNGVDKGYYVDSIGFEEVSLVDDIFAGKSEIAVKVADRYISIQECDDGWDYSIYDTGYRLLDGGVYDDPELSIREVFDDIFEDILKDPHLKGRVESGLSYVEVDFEKLVSKADEAEESETSRKIIESFKEKTEMHFKPINGMNQEAIEKYVKEKVLEILAENDMPVDEIVGLALVGSRSRGEECEDSDLDFVLEYRGEEREDDFFNLLKEYELEVGGISLDISPIKEEKTGTLAEFLIRAEDYMKGVTPERIVKRLCNLGYNAEIQEAVKNGVIKKGIVIRGENSNVSPIIYMENVAGKSLDAAVEHILMIDREHSHSRVSFDIKEVLSEEYLKGNVYIGLQRCGTEDLVKKTDTPAEGIEAYIYIKVKIFGETGYIKLAKQHLDMISASTDMLWEWAEKNTFEDLICFDMAEMMPEEDTMFFAGDDRVKMFVISNKECYRGAASVLNESFVRSFAERFGIDKFVALPASIHEFLFVVSDVYEDMDHFKYMVRNVNEEAVNPEDQLSDHAYLVDVSGETVKWEIIE